MRIAFTSSGKDLDAMIDPRFGRTAYIVLLDTENGQVEVYDNSAVQNEAHGAGTATAQQLYRLYPDVLITGNGPGETALKVLKSIDIRIFVDAHQLLLHEAVHQFEIGRLREV